MTFSPRRVPVVSRRAERVIAFNTTCGTRTRMPAKRPCAEKPTNTIPIMRPSLPLLDDYVRRLERIWNSRMLSNFGENVRELESKAQKYLENRNVRAVSSGDTGLMIGLAALDIPRDSECIVTPFTFNSTINAVIWNGLRPRFVDTDPQTFNLDPSAVENAVNSRTKAIVATHVFGNPCDVRALSEIAHDHNIRLVFDAAHGYGSVYKGKKIGNFGDLEVFSLSGTKLVTGGEGGLVACVDDAISHRLELLRNYGFLGDYSSQYVGLNGKMSELNAALACLTIDTIEDAVKRRNEVAALYVKELSNEAGFQFQRIEEDCRCAYKDLGVRMGSARSSVEKALTARGIQTKRYFLPVHKMPAYSRFNREPLPETEGIYEDILCLPIFNEISDSLVRDVCQAVRAGMR